MILEVAILNVVKGKENEFETAFNEAKKIICSCKGFINCQLQKCVEIDNQYILLVNWQTLEDHTNGFRQSESYNDWKRLLHHFYEPFPTVQHYSTV
jgi:heme-degrading monooxygenase HmoA